LVKSEKYNLVNKEDIVYIEKIVEEKKEGKQKVNDEKEKYNNITLNIEDNEFSKENMIDFLSKLFDEGEEMDFFNYIYGNWEWANIHMPKSLSDKFLNSLQDSDKKIISDYTKKIMKELNPDNKPFQDLDKKISEIYEQLEFVNAFTEKEEEYYPDNSGSLIAVDENWDKL